MVPLSPATEPRLHAGQADWAGARAAARALGAAAARPAGALDAPLHLAAGRTLAAAVTALVPLPACDISAMDGYAVAGPGPWVLVGRVLAGDPPLRRELRAGDAAEIATGAPVPAGASAVLPAEQARRCGHEVSGAAVAGRHIRRQGEDITQGAEAAPAGTPVTPALLGLAAALGHDTLPVRPAPGVHAVITGNEVRRDGRPAPGQVRDAIGPMLDGLVRAAGGELADVGFLGDDGPGLPRLLSGSRADVVVCGGTSVGRADHLHAALCELGARLPVDGVACRPGRPMLLATLPDGPHVVGLPGNPFAALAACVTLLQPLLRGLAGRPEPSLLQVRVGPLRRVHDRDTLLVPARLAGPRAVPVGGDGAANLWGAARADVLAVVPPRNQSAVLEVIPLPPG